MSLDFSLMPSPVNSAQGEREIMAKNEATASYGLTLSPEQAHDIVLARDDALRQSGRVEFRGGLIAKLIDAFADSPYIEQTEYAETLCNLIALFYTYKNETQDRISDDELIDTMKEAFNGSCHGSLEFLEGRVLDSLARGYDEAESMDDWEEDE